MKKIIVPVDFSKQSERALKAAASLAKQYGGELFVLHMLELSNALVTSPEGLQQQNVLFLLKIAEDRFKKFLDKPYLEGIPVTPIIKHFKVFSEVNEVAEKHGADMIIMGSNGTDGFEEFFIGSNTEKVVRHSDIPVLVIKGETTDIKIEQFVFASSFEEDNLVAFQKALSFCELFRAELHCVYINTPGENFLSTQDAYKRINHFLTLAKVGKEVEIYNDYTVESGILNYAENISADAIAMATHGRKGLAHFFRGSIGEDIANHSKIPVFTFKI